MVSFCANFIPNIHRNRLRFKGYFLQQYISVSRQDIQHNCEEICFMIIQKWRLWFSELSEAEYSSSIWLKQEGIFCCIYEAIPWIHAVKDSSAFTNTFKSIMLTILENSWCAENCGSSKICQRDQNLKWSQGK